MNHFNLPILLPFRFVKNNNNGIHFDDQFACMQIRFFERQVTYKQKWIKSKTTKLQCESTIYPNDLQIRNKYNAVLKSIVWDQVVDGGTYKTYELVFDVSDVDDIELCYLYQLVEFEDSIKWEALSNPIWVADSWEHVIELRYKNSFNRDDIAFVTGIEMIFLIEADVQDYVPASDRNQYINQVRGTRLLEGFKGQGFQLYIADSPGVSPYIVDILDSIFLCDSTIIADKRFSVKVGSDWKISRVRGYPLIGASLDIVPYDILTSLQFADNTPLPNGIVTAYNIETGFFGPKSILPVTDVENNS